MNSRESTRRRPSFSILMIGVLAVLLPLLAFLQYRWIGQVSESERERLETNLSIATGRFVEDVFREFSRISINFRLGLRGEPLADQLTRNHNDWQATAPYPELVKHLYVALTDSETMPRLYRFDPETAGLHDSEWPPEIVELEQRFDWPSGDSRSRVNYGFGLDRGQVWLASRLASEDSRASSRRTPAVNPGWLIVELDSAFLWSTWIPNMVKTHFDERDYRIAVFESAASHTVLYASDATLTLDDREQADAIVSVAPPGQSRRGPEGIGARSRRGRGPNFAMMGVDWQLIAQHRSGSLEGAVTVLRRRNLAVGFGILALLGVSGALIIVWSERVRSLGRLQMEFAAGISHELRTPLATIRSAAHNIAAGVIKSPEEVREYAGIVQTEGRRLSSMVDQVIQFAQTEAGRRRYDLQPLAVEHVIKRALSTALPDSKEMQTRVVTNVEPSLPRALADETALAHCMGNLLANALKFGPEEGLVRLEASFDEESQKVLLTVVDSGPGIDPADLPHLFEPFYRGGKTAHTPGSGLGLSLVKRMIEGQNGHVSVSSSPGEGTAVTLHIPVEQPGQNIS